MTAHPRRCGENGTFPFSSRRTSGSSPQVRGKPFVLFRHAVNGGLIPAGAGKTAQNLVQQHKRAAHPRRCGENTSNCMCPSRHFGSSPQVRGKPLTDEEKYQAMRLIPAGAGKT